MADPVDPGPAPRPGAPTRPPTLDELDTLAGRSTTPDGVAAYAGSFLLCLRALLAFEDTDGSVTLLAELPDGWRGQSLDVRDIPTRHGPMSYAVRWHGERPAAALVGAGRGARLRAGSGPGLVERRRVRRGAAHGFGRVSTPDVEELEALGLYDPDAPDAEERLGLIQLSLDHGATYDDIREGIEEKRLHAVAAELVIAPGSERLTLEEVIARCRGRTRRSPGECGARSGSSSPDPTQPWCAPTPMSVCCASTSSPRTAFGPDPALSLARTAGASMARLADGAISSARSVLEAPLRAEGVSTLDIARAFVAVAEQVIPPVYPMLETVHRHHLVDSARRYSAWGVAPTAHHTSDAVVGFADLVGYTSLTQRLSPDQIDRLVVGFEDRALAAVAHPGARLVKTIGDEAMFVAGNAEDALDIACALVADPELPSLRVGLASGEVVARDGDLYGPVVNLAARLVATAEPDQIVFDEETLRRLPDGRARAASVGTRQLQGFDEPVEVFALES